MKDVFRDVRFPENMSLKEWFDGARIKQTYRKTKQKNTQEDMLKREQITDLWRAKREKQHV